MTIKEIQEEIIEDFDLLKTGWSAMNLSLKTESLCLK